MVPAVEKMMPRLGALDNELDAFGPAEGFEFDGNYQNMPDWADRGWASYSDGPALAVPKGDPYAAPYVTVTARIGDSVFINKDRDRFFVVRGSPKEASKVDQKQQAASLEGGADEPNNGAENQEQANGGDGGQEAPKPVKKTASRRSK